MKLLKFIVFGTVFQIIGIFDKYRVSYYKYLYGPRVNIADDFRLGHYSSIVIFPGATKALLTIETENVFRKFCLITLDASGRLVLGKKNFFNNNCSINCLGNIVIGNDNLFGENVKIYDHNHVFNKYGISVRDQGFKIGQVTIGNNCWIGSNCVILNDITIGDNVVIGANNLILKSVPSNTILKAIPQYSSDDINFR